MSTVVREPIPLRPVATGSGAAPSRMVRPFRALFPLGVLFAVVGALPWLLQPLGVMPDAAALHRVLMIEGFELSFVLGFMLTALPGFTGGEPCRPWELGLAILLQAVFGAALLIGVPVAAHAAFVGATGLLAVAAARRTVRSHRVPPEEFLFVAFGLACGALGGGLQMGAAAAWWHEPAPQFGVRLVALGTVLSLVMGIGALLVPAFIGIRDPLLIPGIAKPHARAGRRGLYLLLIATFATAFALEATGHARAGAVTRAGAATVLGLWVWKLTRPPGHRTRHAYVLWISGWMVMLGLWGAALDPAHAVAALHITFIGGFGMLTMGIASRVLVAHGARPAPSEDHVLSPVVLAGLAAAIALRVGADWAGPLRTWLLARAAIAWMTGWIGWWARGFVTRPGPAV